MPTPVAPATIVAAGTALSLGGFMATSPLGIPMPQLAWGAFFACIGVVGRGIFEGQNALARQNALGLQYTLGWVLLGLLGAPFGACMVLYGLKVAGIANDSWTAIALMVIGFSGPKGIMFILGAVANFANTTFKLKGAQALPGGPQDAPKP